MAPGDFAAVRRQSRFRPVLRVLKYLWRRLEEELSVKEGSGDVTMGFIVMNKRYKGTKKLIIFSGAGISAESGINTFRDTNGLWENHSIKEICSEYTWKQNFEAVHSFYNQRRVQLSEVQPNNAHKVVATLKKQYGEDCYVITQNVDDLFERVGCKDVLHVHGELGKMECTACGIYLGV